MLYAARYQVQCVAIDAFLPEHTHRLIAGCAAQDVFSSLRFHSESCRCGTKDLHAAVTVFGVSIHHVSGYLHQLSDVSDEKRSLEAQLHAHVDAVSDEVGSLHGPLGIKPQSVSNEVRTVIPRSQQSIFIPQFPLLPEFHHDGVCQSLFAHGFNYACGADDGYAALDTQPGIEGLLSQFHAFGYADHHVQSAFIGSHFHDLLQVFPDHASGSAVYGSISHRLIQSGLGDTAHSYASVYVNTRFICK